MAIGAPLFTPSGQTLEISVGTTSTSVNVNPNATLLRLLNAGTNLVFVHVSTGPATAVLTDYPLVADVPEIIAKPIGADTVSAITTGSANPLYITTGD